MPAGFHSTRNSQGCGTADMARTQGMADPVVPAEVMPESQHSQNRGRIEGCNRKAVAPSVGLQAR